MKYIHLSNRGSVLVDDEDYAWLSQWKWRRGTNGYAVRSTCYEKQPSSIAMHRAILNFPPKPLEVDHINRNRLDNRRSNLRIVEKAVNLRNRGLSKNNWSGVKGICWDKTREKWQVLVTVAPKKRITVGFYDLFADAKAVLAKTQPSI